LIASFVLIKHIPRTIHIKETYHLMIGEATVPLPLPAFGYLRYCATI